MENEIVTVEQPKLYTIDEIATMIGKTPDTVRKQIKRYGLAPAVPFERVWGGTTPAKYDAAALSKIKEEEELSWICRQRNAARSIQQGMSSAGKQEFVALTLFRFQ